jgi:hypothetical protein
LSRRITEKCQASQAQWMKELAALLPRAATVRHLFAIDA